jgi:hypothetical protein
MHRHIPPPPALRLPVRRLLKVTRMDGLFEYGED